MLALLAMAMSPFHQIQTGQNNQILTISQFIYFILFIQNIFFIFSPKTLAARPINTLNAPRDKSSLSVLPNLSLWEIMYQLIKLLL